MRSFNLSRVARLVAMLAVAVLLGCSKSTDSTAPAPPVTGPRFDFRFPGAGPNGTSQKLVFTDIGTWNYVCTTHAPGMAGAITVAAAGVDSQVVNLTNSDTFSPATVTLKQGGYIRWVNQSSMTNHTVTR